MFNKDIVVKVNSNVSKFISKCLKYDIDLLNVSYVDDDIILVKIHKEDYSRLKKLCYFSKITKDGYLGIDAFLLFLKRNRVVLITVFFCFVLMYFIENIIVDVDVIHSNKEMIELVEKELKINGIKTFTYKKDYDELESIKNEIIESNPEKIEWMSITRKGMKYIVRLEERILTDIEENGGYCHVVAKKSGIIKKITSDSGEIIPAINDYVKEGDIIISGEIHLYEEVKDNICASGEVYAEVWYDVNVSVPLNHLEKTYTGNSRYNFIINNKRFFKDKYENYDEEVLNKLNIFGFNIKYIREKEYKNYFDKYSEDEALEKAINEIIEKMQVKLGEKGEILSKKVLKKSQNNSKMDVEVFLVVLEDIGQTVKYEIEGEESDTE